MHVLQLHGQHADARAVAVEDGLQKLSGLALDLQFAVGDGRIDLAVADNLAHGGLGRVAHQGRGRAHVKQILHGVIDFVLHAELHVDDVFVARKHGGFFGDSAQLALLKSGGLPHGTEAHLAAQHLGDLRLVDAFDGHGPGVMGAGALSTVVLAEAQHHALLVGVNDVDAGKQPQTQHGQPYQPHGFAAGRLELRQFFKRIVAKRRTAAAEIGSPGAAGFVFARFGFGFRLMRRTRRLRALLFLPFFLQFVPIPVHYVVIPCVESAAPRRKDAGSCERHESGRIRYT